MNTGTNYNNAVDFVDNDNNWTAAEWDNAEKDNAALDAHWGAQMTYDYFMTVHNRDSYDDSGAKIRSYVHYSVNYENAFWNGSVMTYGDGNTRFDALTSLDVAAHEIGHAVMSSTANMVYEKEPGAMNEGYSDIWGASVEYFAAPEKSTWLIGEDIDMQQAALRSMSDPKSQGQPDTYLGINWVSVTGCSPSSSNDYCGVHTNSGVLNYWYYLLSVGGSGTNDIGTSYAIAGISIDKAAKIAYRAESVYLGANSVYNDARNFTIQAAQDLYGVDSNEEIQTTNAWNAVGIGAKYGSIDYCASKANNTNDEYIGRVQLGTIDNTTGGSAGGYGDYTSISTDLVLESTNTITITPVWTGTVYREAYSVWIDFNADGDFGDSGEQVFSKAASKTTPVSGSFIVPASAKPGTTRMRVSMKYNALPSECETFQWGEVEDYSINITGGGPDTTPPSAPTNLTAANITINSVDLSWTASTDNVGVTGYDVYQDGSLIASVTTTSHSVTGLASGTTFAFAVQAKDAAGNLSAFSTTVNVTTETPDTTPPSVPTGLVASAITQTSLTLAWDASTDNVGVTGYDVYQDGSLITSVTGTSTNISGLTAGTTYAYTVTAKDAAGNISAASAVLNVTTEAPDTTPPSVPTGLVASAVTQTSLTLSWDASTDNVGVSGYDVYQDGGLIASVTGTSTNVSGLTAGTTYAYTVTAKDAAGNVSAASAPLNVTTVAPDTTPPSVPTGLVATAVTESSLTLSWDASTDNVGVTGYDVYQDGGLIASVTGTSTNVSGLSASTTYAFTVTAKDAEGNVSAASDPLNVTTEATTITYCTTKGNSVNYEYIDLVQLGTINNVTGANGGYGDFTSLSTTLVTGSTNTINFSAGFPGSTWSENWKIWIDFNHDGDFTDSGEEIVSGSTSNGGTYNGTFTVPAGASLGATRMRVVMAWNSTPPSCGTFSYGEAEDYTVIISATSLDSFAGLDSPLKGVDINPDLWRLSLKTYPNPVAYELNLNFNEFKEVSDVKIYNLNGIEMNRFKADQLLNTVNVSELGNGIYILFVETERGRFETKFIKQ
jgi:chitodextrinase